MTALSPVEEVNERAMQRYRGMVQIEMIETGVWVTIDGEHHFNDAGKLAEAIRRLPPPPLPLPE